MAEKEFMGKAIVHSHVFVGVRSKMCDSERRWQKARGTDESTVNRVEFPGAIPSKVKDLQGLDYSEATIMLSSCSEGKW